MPTHLGVLKTFLHREKSFQQQGDSKAQQGAEADLQGGMSQEFLQHILRRGILPEGKHQIVEDLGMLSGLPPHAHGIMHHNDGKDACDGEDGRRKAVFQRGSGGHGRYRCRVAAGHPSVAKQAVHIQRFVYGCIENGLDDLSGGPGSQGIHKKMVVEYLKTFKAVSSLSVFAELFSHYIPFSPGCHAVSTNILGVLNDCGFHRLRPPN